MLNPQSPIPLYRQLADIILNRISTEEYKVGAKIPPELTLADVYQVGRPTVRQAIDHLVRKKKLYRRRGSGTYVQEPSEEVDLFSLAGTTAAFSKKNEEVTIKILDAISLVKIAKDTHNPFANKKAYHFKRLTIADFKPVLLEDIFLDPEVFSGIEQMALTNQPLSKIVEEKFYLKPEYCKQNFSVEFPTKVQEKLLEMDTNDPLLKVHRYLHFPNLENGIYSVLLCRTDQYVFSQTIKGSAQ